MTNRSHAFRRWRKRQYLQERTSTASSDAQKPFDEQLVELQGDEVIVVVGNDMAQEVRQFVSNVHGDRFASSIPILSLTTGADVSRLDGHKGKIIVHPEAWANITSKTLFAVLSQWCYCGIKPHTWRPPLPIAI